MKKILALLLFVTTSVLAETPREPFPSDYKPLPCARPELIGAEETPEHIGNVGRTLHRMNLRNDWLDAHWDEMMAAFKPVQAKVANCLAIPSNSWLFCNDFMFDEFVATNHFAKGTDDYDQWAWATRAYHVLLDNSIRASFREGQKCSAEQPLPGERRLDVWMVPAKFGPDFDGTLTVYAIDAETRIPIEGYITVEGQTLPFSRDSPVGLPMSQYRMTWPVKFNEARTSEGHREFVVPTMVITAKGYPVVRMPIPIDVPKLTIEMTPSVLKRGKNEITITARDAVTGKPAEMRVMGGDQVLGDTNKPFTIELARGQKRPEIWITSLFDKYGDVVVAKAE